MATVAHAQTPVRARSRSKSSTRARRRTIGRGWLIATYATLVVFLLWTVIPFFWMITASLKTNKEIYGDFTILPQSLYFGHYVTLLSGKFSIWMRNSAEVSLVITE